MAVPLLDDYRLTILAEIYALAADEIAARLQEIMFTEGTRQWIIYQQVLRILHQLEQKSNAWTRRFIQEFFLEHDRKVVFALRRMPIEELELEFTQVNEAAIQELVNSMVERTTVAIDSVRTLSRKVMDREANLGVKQAQQVKRAVAEALAKGGGAQEVNEGVRKILEKRFRQGVVTITGRDSRTYTFGLDYYATMVAHNTQRQAATAATIARAEQNSFDLVRVSPNPSILPDCICNLYRGRVFSISGTSDKYPYLGDTPGGGPPFHPWCRHSISIFVPELHDQAEIDEWSDVPDQFLQGDGESFGDVQRRYRNALKDDPTLAELHHI